MLNVAIAVDAPTAFGPRAAAVVAGACEEVIGIGRCPLAAELPSAAVAAWFALVHPEDGALTRVRIDFRDRTADGVLIEQRALSFSGREDLHARLLSIGSVIAALAAAREGSLVPPEAAAPVRAPTPPPPSAPVTPVGPRVRPSFDFAGVAVPAVGGGVDRFGAFARANLDLRAPVLFSLGADYTAHLGDTSFGWWTVFAGVGTRIAPRPARLGLELRAELVFTRVNVSAHAGNAVDSGAEEGWGGRLGVTLLWRALPWVSFVGGVDGTLVAPRVAVVVGSAPATELPAATCGFFLGFRLGP